MSTAPRRRWAHVFFNTDIGDDAPVALAAWSHTIPGGWQPLLDPDLAMEIIRDPEGIDILRIEGTVYALTPDVL